MPDYKLNVVHIPITVGTQSGKLTAGTAGSASFAINTANIATPSAITLVNVNSITGIALATASLTKQDMDITITTTADTPAGTHLLQLTIGNVTSLEFTLTVDNAAAGGGGSSGGCSSGGNSGGSSGGGSSGNTNTTPTSPDTNTDTASGGGTSTATITADTSVSGGEATAAISDSEISDSIAAVKKEAGDKGTTPVVEIKLDTKSADSAKLNLTVGAVEDLTDANAKLKVNMSDLGTLTFDSKALEAISADESTASAPVTITAEKLMRADLPEALQNAVKPTDVLLDFSVKAGDKTISNLNGGTVDVTVPYTVSSAVKPATVVVYYLDAKGNLQIVLGRYDDASKTVHMTLKHFSKYLIRVNAVAWEVTDGGWYTEETMDFAAARGLLDSYITDGKVKAGQGVTRGDFIANLLKALGVQPSETFTVEQFTDVDPTDPNAAYLRTAKQLGVIDGVNSAHTLFEPYRVTTRGEQFQVIMNLIDAGLTTAARSDATNKTLDDFADAADVPNWLKPAITELIRLGVIKGDGTSLMVKKDFTVGETATLYERLG
ncbi:MAG: S-layer homology domain-containing protein [Clostridiales Family XIII bacterium]|nr:S-layer homology domain-containing protein [Clostridiales Family XIII bacterium]